MANPKEFGRIKEIRWDRTKIIIVIFLYIISALSILLAIKKGVNNSPDFQWDAAKIIANRIDPYEASLNESSIYNRMYFDEYGVLEANQFPSLLWLLYPYTFFSASTAKIAWMISNILFLAGSIILLHKMYWYRINKVDIHILMGVLLSSGCIRSQLHLGQHTLFSFFFFLCALYFCEKNTIMSGIFLAISYFKYSITAPLMLVFIYKKRYKEVIVSLIPHIFLTIFSAIWLRKSPISLILLPLKFADINLSTAGFADISSVIGKILQINMNSLLSILIFIVLLVWVVVQKTKYDDFEMICILATWSLVFMYHRRYDYFLLILPFSELFSGYDIRLDDVKSRLWSVAVCIATIGVLLLGNFTDLTSAVGLRINSIIGNYLPYEIVCSVINGSSIVAIYILLIMNHICLKNGNQSIKNSNKQEENT